LTLKKEAHYNGPLECFFKGEEKQCGSYQQYQA